ncbi:unnamed protein product [Gadus morhua 'NCC']
MKIRGQGRVCAVPEPGPGEALQQCGAGQPLVLLHAFSKESICAAQLITEDEGLGRLAHTLQVLVDLAPTAASHRRASRPEPLGADRLSTAPSFS